MAVWFNIAGPCLAGEHSLIPPEQRVGEALPLTEQGRWFSLVSGRQTGKTTVVQWLCRHLDATGTCLALSVDLETARDKPEVDRAMQIVLRALDQVVAHAEPGILRPGPAAIQAMLEVPERALLQYAGAPVARPRPHRSGDEARRL